MSNTESTCSCHTHEPVSTEDLAAAAHAAHQARDLFAEALDLRGMTGQALTVEVEGDGTVTYDMRHIMAGLVQVADLLLAEANEAVDAA